MHAALLAFAGAFIFGQPAAVSADEQALQAAHLATNASGLLDYFRKRTPPGPDVAVLRDLVKRLSAETPAVRDQAAGGLVCYGPVAVPFLRQAVNGIDDQDLTARATTCLQLIEGANGVNLTVHAARCVAMKAPPGGAAALLAYLPFAENAETAQELELALAAYAPPGTGVDDALIAALKDESPIRRAVAAAVLCGGGPRQYAAVRPLLKDPRPTVRFRAAMGLVGSHDSEAVPVLIDLLPDLPPAQRTQAEEFLAELAGEWAVAGPKGNDLMSRRLGREAWMAWWRATDGTLLLNEFRSRTLTDKEQERVARLLAELEAESAQTRDKAMADLVAMGRRAAPLLRRAAARNGARAAYANKCLELIERDSPTPLPAAAARVLALRRPEGTLEALLAYLPCAESETVANQVIDLLAVVGVTDGKASPGLLTALDDKSAARRAGAAVALCRGRAKEQFGAVRKCLKDPEAEVRLRAALALAEVHERDAIPVLIALLTELPLVQAWETEEFLNSLAGEKPPSVSVGEDPPSRVKARDAWSAWWRDYGRTVDLRSLSRGPRFLGYWLVVESFDPVRRSGRIAEFDAAGKLRWQIEGLQYPQYAEVLPGDRALIAEQNLNRVTEREPTGKVVWEKSVPSPFRAQRLRSGATFVACRNQLVEFDRDGKETFRHNRQGDMILAARKFRDGHCAFVSYQGLYVRLDAAGKEVKTFRVPFNPNGGISGCDMSRDDHVLICTSNMNKVAEFGPDGKTVWETTLPFPGLPNRLANGHTLVASHSSTRITELDRAGKAIAEHKNIGARPTFASRR